MLSLQLKDKMKNSWIILLVLGLTTLSSCKLFYPNQMFRQKDYQYFEFATKQLNEYTIESGNQLSVQVYSRDGFKLIDVLGGGESNAMPSGGNNNSNIAGSASSNSSVTNSNSTINRVNYLVDNDGFARLPILGEFYVRGYSHKELEKVLAEKYSSLFVDPYVVVKVNNRRVFVFKGSTGGEVVYLNETPTSLIEVLAKAGGLDRTVKAYNIKILRGDLKNPQVQIVDLSTLEGLRKAELTLQPNDIVYVSDRKRVVRDALLEATPIFSAISLVTTTIVLIKTLGK
jgi:polysaccharide export outer membrane protein